MAMSPEMQFILQQIAEDVKEIREAQVKQGKDLERLRTLATVAGSIGGFVTGIGSAIAVKLFGGHSG